MTFSLLRGLGRIIPRFAGKTAAAGRPAAPRRRRGRAVLLWGVVGFVLAQAAFFALRDRLSPTIVDPEYGRKLNHLRAKLRHKPAGQPVVALIGSSRTAMGIRPDVMWDDRPPAERPALVMNFGICGAGPVGQHITLDRLHRDGVRPDTVVAEVWVPLMTEDYHRDTGVAHLTKQMDRYRWTDARLVTRYLPDPGAFRREWYGRQAVPWLSYRQRVLRSWAPSWVPKELRNDATYRDLDDWGFLTLDGYREHPPADYFAGLVSGVRNSTTASLSPFRVSPHLDHAQRDLLTLAGRQGIHVVLLLIPEPAAVRELYRTLPGGADADRYIRGLAAEFGTALVDARGWLPDTAFADGSHLTPDGAGAFARKLQRVLDR
jgi:hypothetical protein